MNFLNRPWNVVFFTGFVAYFCIRGAYAHRTKRETKIHREVDWLEKALLLLVISSALVLPMLYLFSPWLAFADYRLPAWAGPCGAVVMLLALWMFWRSHADLGQNWSVTLEVREGHQLVTRGVYRTIRHPMYASIFLWGIAQALMLPNWLAGWSAFVPFLVMYVLRMPREERMMCAFFGQEYRNYMARTGRLFPRIRREPVRATGE